MNGALLDSFPTNEKLDDLISDGVHDTQIIKHLKYLGIKKQHEFKDYVKRLANGYAFKEASQAKVRLRFIFTRWWSH